MDFQTEASRRLREKKLIEMLVKAEFPVKKRSKTSAEILTQNHCDTMKALTKSVASTVGQNEKLETEETVSENEQRNQTDQKKSVDKSLNQLFKEMDKMDSVVSMERAAGKLTKEGTGLKSTISIIGSPKKSSRKAPPLDARLLTTHSVLVGDLTLGRNFKIFGLNGESVVEDALYAIGWNRLDEVAPGYYAQLAGSVHYKSSQRFSFSPATSANAPVHLTWADSPSRIRNSYFTDGEEMVNHVPNMALLSDKIKLFENLSAYERQVMGGGMRRPGLGIVGHIKMEKFIPTTYRVDVATDRTRFYREFRQGQIWICKPSNENCGRGIFLVRSLDEFHNLIMLYEEHKDKNHQPNAPRQSQVASAAAKPTPNQAPKTQPAFHNHAYNRVVQRYITNPLLVHGRKADLRAYLLVASTDPYIVLFRPGYVRLAMDEYDAKGQSPFSHLTNQCVQRKHPDYKAKRDDSVMTMDSFNEFVNASVAAEVGVAENWARDTLPTEMKKIMVQCFQAIRANLPSASTNGRFELLGVDFMLDDKLNLWLIEVNVNPALARGNATLASVIPAVVQEALYISIECFEKQKVVRGPLSPLHTCKEFQVIYEEYSSSKWIFGQNASPRWNPSFAIAEEEKLRLSVTRRQALCPRLPLGAPIRGKWAAPHEENAPSVICGIAATRHLIETMREALDARDDFDRGKKRKRNEEEEKEEEPEKGIEYPEENDDVKWLRERWR